MDNFSSELSKTIRSRIGIGCEVMGDFENAYSNFYIRSLEPEYANPRGWFVHVEILKETFRLDFEFDESAGLLCKFYYSKVISPEINTSVLEMQKSFNQNYFPLNFIADDTLVDLSAMTTLETPLNFKIKSKGRIEDVDQYGPRSMNLILDFLLLSLFPLLPDQSDEQPQDFLFEYGLPEGASKKVIVNRYERDPRNRLACIKHYGTSCIVCNFDFGDVYGDFASDYIHVHHLIPVSKMGDDYKVDPINDLVPLCPNCHSAVHISNPPLTPDELRIKLRK